MKVVQLGLDDLAFFRVHLHAVGYLVEEVVLGCCPCVDVLQLVEDVVVALSVRLELLHC